MRYRELGIQTRREVPARAKSAGESWLLRAGYWAAHDNPTELGLAAIKRLRTLAESSPELFGTMHLPVVKTEAGELVFELSSGDREFLRCPECGYVAGVDEARVRKFIPADGPPLVLNKVATPNCSTIESLANLLGIGQEQTAKALMYRRVPDGQFVFVVLRGDTQLSEKKLRRHVGELQPASTQEIEAAGAVPGYASPIGLKNATVVVDDLIPLSGNLVAGANEAGYHLQNTNYGRDYRADLVADLTLARQGDACPNCGTALRMFSTLTVADANGYKPNMLLLALAETFHDDHGLCIPTPASAFDVYLLHLGAREDDTLGRAELLYESLQTSGVSVLFDDRDERAGVKFNDADLIGCPIRITVGKRNLKNGMVEFKSRTEAQIHLVAVEDVVHAVLSHLAISQ